MQESFGECPTLPVQGRRLPMPCQCCKAAKDTHNIPVHHCSSLVEGNRCDGSRCVRTNTRDTKKIFDVLRQLSCRSAWQLDEVLLMPGWSHIKVSTQSWPKPLDCSSVAKKRASHGASYDIAIIATKRAHKPAEKGRSQTLQAVTSVCAPHYILIVSDPITATPNSNLTRLRQ